jgi:hypothetical protein
VRSKRGMLTIEYESGELEECLNPQAASHGFGLQPGDRIEVFARVTAAATVSTCGSERYFIRLSEAEE